MDVDETTGRLKRTSSSRTARRAASGEPSDTAAAGALREGPVSSVVPPWLLKAKVMVPAATPGYVYRSSLLQQIDAVLDRRGTTLQAPAGFGNTTVLADVSRRKKEQGLVVGWLSLDEDDVPNVFGSYIAYAFEHAGLDLASLASHDGWSSSPIAHQIGMLARAIELHAAACLLVLDEVDRLPASTVALIDLLVKRAPPNLHFALAFRSNPGLDLAPHVLEGSAVIVSAQEFRFSKPEIARFFDGDLSRRKLAVVAERTAGWPVALMVYRNMRSGEVGQPGADTARLTSNFIGVRLLRDLSAEDRTFLLDLAVFDWIEADLVDEVLGSSDARLRIATLSSLDGLLLPMDHDSTVRRLHPLVREYCVERFAVEYPVRKRSLHTRIALALARRGQLTPACRHASEAGDSGLVGRLIEEVGVARLWLREGLVRVVSAGQFLTPEITERYPRLALLRCVFLNLLSKFDEAATLYEVVARKTDGFTRDRDGGDAAALSVDQVFTELVLAGGPCRSEHGEFDTAFPANVTPGDNEFASFRLGARHMVCCVACYERGRFEEARQHGMQARARFGEDARYGSIFVSICLGMAAMAQGRVREATEWYRRARQGARKYFPSDPYLSVNIDVMTIELDLERNRGKAIQQRTLQGMTEMRGWIDLYAATVAVRAELTFEQSDSHAVVTLLTRRIDGARAMGNDNLLHYLSALLASYLVEIGRSEEAGNVWRNAALPCSAAELLDLDGHSWRTMEALCCARVRLLIAQGDLDAAGELASHVNRTASAHGLVRTAMRSLALSMVVAHHAAQPDRAVKWLVEFLRRLREADYIRPLVRHGDVSATVLRQLLAGDLDAELRETAEAALAHLAEPAAAKAQGFSSRELEVLMEVRHGRRNKEIAERLGITDEGVRYHLKKIYRKTGVSRRLDAVRYAQAKGMLS